MSAITINLDPVALREATTQAIMGILTPELREKLITQAISALLNPVDQWGNKPKSSPLQVAFDNAIEHVARMTAREAVESNVELKARISALMAAAAAKAIETDPDKLAAQMGAAFVASMRRD